MTHEPSDGLGKLQRAAVHQQQRRLVGRDVGLHRADDADVVDALAEFREELADLDARLAVLLELERRRERQRRSSPGSVLPAYFASAGFGSNVSTCDGPPLAKMWMTCLRLGGKRRLLGGQRVGQLGAGAGVACRTTSAA